MTSKSSNYNSLIILTFFTKKRESYSIGQLYVAEVLMKYIEDYPIVWIQNICGHTNGPLPLLFVGNSSARKSHIPPITE